MPYSKQQQRKHISDDVVKRACEERAAAADSPKPFLTGIAHARDWAAVTPDDSPPIDWRRRGGTPA